MKWRDDDTETQTWSVKTADVNRKVWRTKLVRSRTEVVHDGGSIHRGQKAAGERKNQSKRLTFNRYITLAAVI